MALTERQVLAYTDTCTIYKPAEAGSNNPDGFTKDPTWTLVASSVACKYFSTRDQGSPSVLGRSSVRNKDFFHFDTAQECEMAYAIVLTTAGHADTGKCYMVEGHAQDRPSAGSREANYKCVEVKLTKPKPKGVA